MLHVRSTLRSIMHSTRQSTLRRELLGETNPHDVHAIDVQIQETNLVL